MKMVNVDKERRETRDEIKRVRLVFSFIPVFFIIIIIIFFFFILVIKLGSYTPYACKLEMSLMYSCVPWYPLCFRVSFYMHWCLVGGRMSESVSLNNYIHLFMSVYIFWCMYICVYATYRHGSTTRPQKSRSADAPVAVFAHPLHARSLIPSLRIR